MKIKIKTGEQMLYDILGVEFQRANYIFITIAKAFDAVEKRIGYASVTEVIKFFNEMDILNNQNEINLFMYVLGQVMVKKIEDKLNKKLN